MTDPHDIDELASAHLDGATSPEEAARIERDPALLARVEELRAVRAAMSQPPLVAPAHREAAIAAALTAFDEADEADGSPAPVTPLAPRRGLSPTAVRVLGAAAVVALLALLVPILSDLGGDDDQMSFDATGDAIEGANDEEAGGQGDGAAELDPNEGPAPATAGDSATGFEVNTYEDFDALAAAVIAGQLQERGPASAEDGTGEATALQLCAEPIDEREVEAATVGGEPVLVWVHDEPGRGRVLTMLSADGCVRLDEREL